MKSFKTYRLILLFLILNLILSGCGLLGNEGAYEEGVIRVWTTWSDKPARLQALFDRYSQGSGQTIKVRTGVRSDDILDALNSSTPPEIVILSSSEFIGVYAEQGLIEPLDSLAGESGIDLNDLYPAALGQCEWKNQQHLCLPWGADVEALFWNKDLFQAAGLEPDRPPQSMAELAEYAEKLTVRSQPGKFSQIGFIPDYPRSHTKLYVQRMGGDWTDGSNDQMTANSQPVVDAENWQLQFYNPADFEKVNPFIATFDRYRNSGHPLYAGMRLSCQQCHRETPPGIDKLPDNGFYTGKVAMMVSSQWQVGANGIAATQPDLHYGVAAFPPSTGQPQLDNQTVVHGPVMVIPARVKDKAAAAKLLAWMMSPEIAADEAYANYSLPASRTAASDARFQQMPYYNVFLDLLASPNAAYNTASPRSPLINQALTEMERDLLHKKGGDPAVLLNAIQDKLTP